MNKAAPSQEYDINKCPGCGGEADNGHDREVPPNPYYCTKCEAAPSQEPVAWMYQEYTRKFIGFDWFDEVQFVQPPNEPDLFRNITPLYTTPPDAAAPITISDERLKEIFCENCKEEPLSGGWPVLLAFARAILAEVQGK